MMFLRSVEGQRSLEKNLLNNANQYALENYRRDVNHDDSEILKYGVNHHYY